MLIISDEYYNHLFLPVPTPAKNLAAYIIGAPFANMISNQLSMNGITSNNIVGLRPIKSASMPTGIAKMRAPIANIELIHDPKIKYI